MGGNAYVRRDGEVIAQAQRVHLRTPEDRDSLVETVNDILGSLTYKFNRVYGTWIWPRWAPEVFSGSTRHLMNPNLPSEELIRIIPSIGDIDVMIPEKFLEPLRKFISPGDVFGVGTYVGCSETSIKQMSCVFDVGWGKIQIDFSSAPYDDDGLPTYWASFSRSSSLKDLQCGIRGVFHKYIIGSVDFAFPIYNITVVSRKLHKHVRTYIDTHEHAFSSKGVRKKYTPAFDGEGKRIVSYGMDAYFELPPAEAEYTTDIGTVFEMLFRRQPQGFDLMKLESFVGIVDLMQVYFNADEQGRVLDALIGRCFTPGAQQLVRNDPGMDYAYKMAAFHYFLINTPSQSKRIGQIEDMAADYRRDYKMMADRRK